MRRQRLWKRSSHVVPSVTISIKARPTQDANLWINGGFFIFRSQIFEYLGEGEKLDSAKGLLLSNIRRCIWSHPRHGSSYYRCVSPVEKEFG